MGSDIILLVFILQLGCGSNHSVGALAGKLAAFVAGATRRFGAIAFGLALTTVLACQCNPLALRGAGMSRDWTRILLCRRMVHDMTMREGRGAEGTQKNGRGRRKLCTGCIRPTTTEATRDFARPNIAKFAFPSN